MNSIVPNDVQTTTLSREQANILLFLDQQDGKLDGNYNRKEAEEVFDYIATYNNYNACQVTLGDISKFAKDLLATLNNQTQKVVREMSNGMFSKAAVLERLKNISKITLPLKYASDNLNATVNASNKNQTVELKDIMSEDVQAEYKKIFKIVHEDLFQDFYNENMKVFEGN